MSCYFIGIGGTGAKCAEAFTHLNATGLLGNQSCKMFFVDQDRGNGILSRSLSTIEKYGRCRQFRATDSQFFSANLQLYAERIWVPLPEQASRSLRKYFSYEDPSERYRHSARMMDVLFSRKQIDLPLDEGFRGNPAIGSAILGATVDLNAEQPWAELYRNLEDDSANRGGASLILAGSVFGGTGAAGIPTIARLIKNHLKQARIENIRMAVILMLPYFAFGQVRDEEIQANAREFLPASQDALHYYNKRRYLDFVDSVYLLGEESLSFVPVPSLGGGNQQNEPHPLELYAALAAIDFFTGQEQRSGCVVTSREKKDNLGWQDFPFIARDLRKIGGNFIRFAYAFLAMGQPTLANYIKLKESYKIAWLRNFFPRQADINFQELELQTKYVGEYCASFLQWVASLYFSARSANIDLELSFVEQYARFSGEPPKTALLPALQPNFDGVLLPHREKEGLSFADLYDALADTKTSETRGTPGLSQFVNQLYQLCGKGLT